MNRRRQAGTLVALAFACASLAAQQSDRAQTEALAQRAADRLTTLHAEADRLASDERTLLGDLRRLELEREIRSEELRQIERETSQVTTELAALDTQVSAMEGQEQRDTPRLRARLISLYKLGQGRYLRLLLSSDMRQMAQAARSVAALAGQDETQVAQHAQRLAALQASQSTLDERRRRLTELRTNAARAGAAASDAVATRNTLITDIDQRRDLNAQLAGELQGAQQRLQATLASLTAGTTIAAGTLPIGPFRGDLDWPVSGNLRQSFGRPTRGGSAVNGIDIAAPEGSPVHAVHDGTVAFAGPFAGFAQLVIVDHGGQAFSLYGNLRDTSVLQGAHLTSGQPLGSVGTSPTGAAGLYFELRIDGRPVDPLQWLRKK